MGVCSVMKTQLPKHWMQWNVKRYQDARDLMRFSKVELKAMFPDIAEYEGSNWTKEEIVPYILNSWEV